MKTILLAIPAMQSMPTTFVVCLLDLLPVLRKKAIVRLSIAANSLIYEARTKLAAQAVQSGMDYILWIDSDMVFTPESILQLIDDVDEYHRVVSALCFRRTVPTTPCICTEEYKPYVNYPKDRLFVVEATGFGCCITETKLLLEVGKNCSPFAPINGLGEDYSFCKRANDAGVYVWCDSRVKIGHLMESTVSERDWLKQQNDGRLD